MLRDGQSNEREKIFPSHWGSNFDHANEVPIAYKYIKLAQLRDEHEYQIRDHKNKKPLKVT